MSSVIAALIIFIITYIFIGLRQIPRVHVDRPAGALVGAVLMIVSGVLTLDQAFASIDMHTLLLLLGMMIITVYLRTAGFFELMADKILSHTKTPLHLLILVTLSSALLSALFVNDTICLLYTPIVLEVASQLGVNPMPYLIALAVSSNIGSVMTVTGNPQNMLIGIYSKIPYLSFFTALAPVALVGLCVSVAVIWFIYRKEMTTNAFSKRPAMPRYEVRKALLAKGLLTCVAVLVAFSLGYPYSLVAAAGAVMLLLIGNVATERILEGVDWTLLLFFSGLFVVMHGVEVSGLAAAIISRMGDFAAYSSSEKIAALSGISLVLSNLVSNVPAVMLLKPLTESLGDGQIFWLTLAMSSTLAGNFTLIGSVANLIVVQQARRRVEIGFMEYFRVGAVVTVLTILAGILVLAIEVRIAEGVESVGQHAQKNGQVVRVIPSQGSGGVREYRIVRYCDTRDSRAKGLQGFRRLGRDEAALFVFEKTEPATFWMGSVSFPIDIVFIGPDRRVLKVYPDCKPGSLDYYSSIDSVKWVIETAAGSGIRPGDQVMINLE